MTGAGCSRNVFMAPIRPIAARTASHPRSSKRLCSTTFAAWHSVHTPTKTAFMRRRAGVSSGSAATIWSPVSCAAKSAVSCRTKSCRCRAPARSTGRRTPFQPAVCAHTWYGPPSNGGKTYAPRSSVNTDVVIGRPGGFAETVTPSSGSPDASVTVPASSASFSPGGAMRGADPPGARPAAGGAAPSSATR